MFILATVRTGLCSHCPLFILPLFILCAVHHDCPLSLFILFSVLLPSVNTSSVHTALCSYCRCSYYPLFILPSVHTARCCSYSPLFILFSVHTVLCSYYCPMFILPPVHTAVCSRPILTLLYNTVEDVLQRTHTQWWRNSTSGGWLRIFRCSR